MGFLSQNSVNSDTNVRDKNPLKYLATINIEIANVGCKSIFMTAKRVSDEASVFDQTQIVYNIQQVYEQP